MAHHDLYDWFGLGAAYLGVLGLMGGVYRYGGQVRDKRRAQAQHVFAWAEPSADTFKCVVRNRSEWPISNVVLDVFESDGSPASWAIGLVDCGDDYRPDAKGLSFDPHFLMLAIGCRFTDASGRRWYRSPRGRLYRWNRRRRRDRRSKTFTQQ